MKKIGIVTVYRNINYGSKLQSYALQKILYDLGFECENLKIDFSENDQLKKINPLSKISLYLKNPAKIFYRRKKLLRIKKFEEYLQENIKESIYTTNEVKKLILNNDSPYSYYICGSDQIWAPNQFNKDYFLNFVSDSDLKIAYAPSIGLPTIPKELINDYRKLISDIGHLSIREKDGAEIIKRITGKDIPVVFDPTLLLTKQEWLEHSIDNNQKNYILCYFLGENKEHRKWVEKLKKQTGYKILVLPFKKIDYCWGDERLFDVGPKEFIGLIKNASVVCTDSYHGMLFSINLNKEFYSFLRFKDNDVLNQNSRIINFLEDIQLRDRIVDLNTTNEYSPINWNTINNYLNEKREHSLSFLKNALIRN